MASEDEKKAIAFLLLGLLIVLCEGFFRYRVFGDECWGTTARVFGTLLTWLQEKRTAVFWLDAGAARLDRPDADGALCTGRRLLP